jgi:tRNA (adenine57-N1/adenine58-N1)-methyltransferase
MTSGLSSGNVEDSVVNFGDKVLLYFDKKRRWIIRVEKGKVFSCDKGKIELDRLVGLIYGSKVKTSANFDVYIMRPLLIDYLERGLKRATQIIYPKDQGFIIMLLGVAPGSRVLEIGVGTGSTTITLASIVKPTGHVYGYEIREDFIDIAKKNLLELGLLDYVTIKLKDARQGVDERDIDAAVVDIGDPWNVLGALYEALKPSAPVVFFVPSMNQVEKLFNVLTEHGGFIDIRCYELLLREIRLGKESIRPANFMVGHTGYIMFARKISRIIT